MIILDSMNQSQRLRKTALPTIALPIALLSVALLSGGCGIIARLPADAQAQRSPGGQQGPPPVDVAIARTGSVQGDRGYTGTTRPNQEVTLRAQVEGRILDMTMDVGDAIAEGQVVAELDGEILRAAVLQEEAELAAQEAEVARLRAQLSDAETQVERARLELRQAEVDASRLQQLARNGAISVQQGETAVTSARTSAQVLRSAQEQVRSQEEAILAAERRVVAQQAAVDQAVQRQAYAVITSPVNGFVLERLTEAGNLVQPGGAILRVGDFSQVKISTQVSDLEIANLRVGQGVQVQLDAFPDRTIRGRISRISPAADPAVRLIPVEVIIPNEGGRIGSGLLARIQFSQIQAERVVVAQSALVENERQQTRQGAEGRNQQPSSGSPSGGSSQRQEGDSSQRQEGGGQRSGNSSPQASSSRRDGESRSGSQPANQAGSANQANREQQRSQRRRGSSGQPGKLFVIVGEGKDAKAVERSVILGNRGNGQVEILSGLQPGERYVVRSGRPLKDGDAVRLSILSEKS